MPDPGERATASSPGDPLEALVFEALDRLESEGIKAVDQLCSQHPEQASGLRRRLAQLDGMGLLGDQSATIPERLGEFRIVARLGGGGMGVVYEAVQEPLDRAVALKLIRPDQLFLPSLRERFAREAQAIARLQHPGIVPIYTIGQAGGVPYFAMELVRGCTLEAALAQVERRLPAELGGLDLGHAVQAATRGPAAQEPLADWLYHGSWEEVCLRIARAVADALDHAHKRGVLHRDVKPSNVMLTPGGRVLLLDFGLAQHEGSQKLTRTSAQVGSLAYLPPEQLDAGSVAADARGDVYSLGVVLYQMLTLRLPYDGGSSAATMLQIANGHATSPRALNTAVSWEAETVCAAAMERDRARRYASASDFARDLANVLEHRPIEARRADTWLRLRRWAQRRPAAAMALAAGVLIAIAGPALYAWREHVAFAKLSQAYQLAEAQRTRAEHNRDRALEAVDQLFTRVSEFKLDSMPRMEPLRRALLEDAVKIHDELAQLNAGDTLVRVEATRARRKVAQLLCDLGRTSEAISSAKTGLAALGEPHGELEQHEAARLELALSTALQLAGQVEAALEHSGAAAASARALVARSSQVDPHSLLLSDALTQYGNQLDLLGRTDEALSAYREGLAAARRACAAEVDVELASRSVATLSNQIGFVLTRGLEQRPENGVEARAVLEEALALLETPTEGALAPKLRYAVCSARSNLAFLLVKLQAFDDARREFDRFALDAQQLTDAHPELYEFRLGLSHAYNNRAQLAALAKDYGAAREDVARAEQVLARLNEDAPGIPDVLGDLGVTRANLGQFAYAQKRYAEALDWFEKAVRAQRDAMALAPQVLKFRDYLGDHLFWLYDVHAEEGRLEPALASIEERTRLLDAAWEPCWDAAARMGMVLEFQPESERTRPELLEKLGARAAAQLREARKRGCPKVAELIENAHLAPLRQTAALLELADELAAAPASK